MHLDLLYSILDKHKSFILIHGPYFQTTESCSEPLEDTDVLLKLQKKYSNVRLILAHSGVGQTIGCAGQKLIKQTIVRNGTSNLRIFADTALTLKHYPSNPTAVLKNVLKEFYAALGENHILFGSDSTARDTDYNEFSKQVNFVKANFDQTKHQKVFNQNAISLMRK